MNPENNLAGDYRIINDIRQVADSIQKQRNILKKKLNVKIGIEPKDFEFNHI
jgi:hypothetical protein